MSSNTMVDWLLNEYLPLCDYFDLTAAVAAPVQPPEAPVPNRRGPGVGLTGAASGAVESTAFPTGKWGTLTSATSDTAPAGASTATTRTSNDPDRAMPGSNAAGVD
jgi:hypothetical protein